MENVADAPIPVSAYVRVAKYEPGWIVCRVTAGVPFPLPNIAPEKERADAGSSVGTVTETIASVPANVAKTTVDGKTFMVSGWA
jgi:hypothetical protein